MSIPYNQGIPNPNNNPSADVFLMQENAVSLFQWPIVDHIGFGTGVSGSHKKITFTDFVSPPPATPLASGSVAYSKGGSASPSTAQMVFQNSNATFLMSCIRAFGQMTIQASTPVVDITFGNSYNVITTPGASQQNGNVYTITLANDCITGTNARVFINFSNNAFVNVAGLFNTRANYTLGVNQIIITTAGPVSVGSFINFVILQA